MLVIKNADGAVVFTASTPDDVVQRVEQFAKQIGGTVETLHFAEVEKMMAEQNYHSEKESRSLNTVVEPTDGEFPVAYMTDLGDGFASQIAVAGDAPLFGGFGRRGNV